MSPLFKNDLEIFFITLDILDLTIFSLISIPYPKFTM